nr:uncharacterized protein LOC107012863 [Ipomoea batatas]GMC56361.1 uncharacterized protein LOC107012863 [Ipomoea batatas]
MSRLVRLTWMRLCKLIMISRPVGKPLRDRAIAVARRVSIIKDKDAGIMKACCPVCLEAFHTPLSSDLRMTLAIHLSLWHADDVNLMWEMMQNKGKSVVHMPSFFFGAGMATGVGALTLLAKNWITTKANKSTAALLWNNS